MNPTPNSNHRACSRTPLNMDVTLFYGEGMSLEGKLLDISFGGVFVEADCAALKINDLVTLDLNVGDDKGDQLCSLSAMVVRKSNDGAGLVFDEYDADTIKGLRRVYHKALA